MYVENQTTAPLKSVGRFVYYLCDNVLLEQCINLPQPLQRPHGIEMWGACMSGSPGIYADDRSVS